MVGGAYGMSAGSSRPEPAWARPSGSVPEQFPEPGEEGRGLRLRAGGDPEMPRDADVADEDSGVHEGESFATSKRNA